MSLKWLILSLYSTSVFSQTVVKEYFDCHGASCAPTISYYYCLGKKNSRGVFYDSLKSFYTKSNAIRAIELRDQFGNRMGNYESYYENGKVKLKSRYDKPSFRIHAAARDSTKYIILEFRDSTGAIQVKNGEGCIRGKIDFLLEHGKVTAGLRDSVWSTFYDNGKIYSYESWQTGQLVDGISYDSAGKEYYYKELLVLPSPAGSLEEFYEQMTGKITYPQDAARRGIEGKVIVEFVVEKNGAIRSPTVLKGLGYGCDEQAVKALRDSPPWEPCREKGQPVKYKMKLPFLFKLT